MSESIFNRTEEEVLREGLSQASRRCEELQELLEIEKGNTLKAIERRNDSERKLTEKLNRIRKIFEEEMSKTIHVQAYGCLKRLRDLFGKESDHE